MKQKDWVELQWEGAKFGDARLTKRAIEIARKSLNNSDKTLPGKFQDWPGLKAAYRFFQNTKITHEQLQAVHNNNVVNEAGRNEQLVLFIQDGSELLYNSHVYTTGLGPTCDSYGNGFMMHSCLAVRFDQDFTADMLGLANQQVWVRDKIGKKNKTDCESEVWLKAIQKIGRPPEMSNWVTVGDRANDIYKFHKESIKLGWNYVIRVLHDRTVLIEQEEKKLKAWVKSLEVQTTRKLHLRTRGDKQGKEITLKISWIKAKIKPPQKSAKDENLEITYVHVYSLESDLEWFLATTLEVTTAEDAQKIISIYEKRWIIEEYHKCLKTGCKVEEAQLQTGKRLLALLGILGVVATQLLKLRDMSRQTPEELIGDKIPVEYIEVIKRHYKLEIDVTVKQFWFRVAMLGGFLARKSDGNPGWQTLWRGWNCLQNMVQGFMLYSTTYG